MGTLKYSSAKYYLLKEKENIKALRQRKLSVISYGSQIHLQQRLFNLRLKKPTQQKPTKQKNLPNPTPFKKNPLGT